MECCDEDIAVVGIGCNFPGGEGLDHFWDVLLQGKNCAVPIPNDRFDTSHWYDPDDNKMGKSRTARAALIDGFNEFDHKFFGITDAEADQMDPQHKLLLQCAYRALENAGMPMEKASGTRTGVFLGLMNRDYELSTINVNPSIINHCTGTGIAMSIAANRISYAFNFTGPSLAIDCACSSSLVALHFSCQSLRQGDCDMAVCGGVNSIIEPRVFVALSKAKMISPDGTSKPFSSRGDGYGRGEGCGIILLKPLKRALQDLDPVWGIISKTAVNQDGHTVSPITKPSMVQQEQLLRRIYSSETDLSSVQYIEAHGTGTPVGDPVEAGSISNVIAKSRRPGSAPLYMGSVKSNIGHTESAAGVAGLIKVLLMMKHETIVPSVFYSEDSSSIDAKALNLKIPTKAERWESSSSAGRVAGVNNFGFGGTNAHAIVKQHVCTRVRRREARKSQQLLVLSAASENSIRMTMRNTAEQIKIGVIDDLPALLYTSACRRSHSKHKYRKVFQTSSLIELKEQLTSTQDKKVAPSKMDPTLVFVFCGNGVTYRGMCRQLLKEEPIFREKVMEIEELLQCYKKMNLIETLEIESEGSDDFLHPDIVQPLLFAIQVALVSLLEHWGIRPDVVLGHSVGEVAAAHCSGLLSLQDAVKVIYHRSHLQSKVTGGKMLVISNMAVSDVLKILPSYSGKVCIAAYNSPESCTLSGDAEAIDRLHQSLSNSENSQNLFLRVLDVTVAYHSHMLDSILLQIEESIGHLQRNDMTTQLFSTVSGKICSSSDFLTGKYWARNVRDPVSFEQTLKSVAKDKKNLIFVEVGPRRALQRNIMETLGNNITVLPSVQPGKDHQTILSVASKVFELGVNIDWNQFYSGCETVPTPFPMYQFDNMKKDVIIAAKNSGKSTTSHPVITQTGKDSSGFSCDLSSDALSYLHEHKHNDVAIIPGAFYAELGLAAFMASAKPKVPLSSLQLSISFQSPFVFTLHSPDMKVQLDPQESVTNFKVHSSAATYASGTVQSAGGRSPDEQCIALDSVYKRCKSVVSADVFYEYLCLGGFQYGPVFKNKGDVYYGQDLREAYSIVTISDELLPQLHDYCIHPVVLDYLMQLIPVTVAHGFLARPGFPSQIGSLSVFEPLQEEMVVYLRAIHVRDDDFEICGCFTDKQGRVLVELKHVMVKYIGSRTRVIEEYFYHNSFSIISEDIRFTSPPTALVFADQRGLSKGLQPHLSPRSKFISFSNAKALLKHGFAELMSDLNISNVPKTYQEVLLMFADDDITSKNPDDVLESVASCCEIFRQIIVQLKAMNFQNSIRTITYRSTENTVDHISPGFAMSGMTRACAAELSNMAFQLIDVNSFSGEDSKALAQILNSYPCNKYPELVVKHGQILKPYIIHTPVQRNECPERRAHSSLNENFVLQTSDPFKMTGLSASPCDSVIEQLQEKTVEVQVNRICVHSSDYFPVSLADLTFGQTIYWNKHTSQNHKLLALDCSGIVTAVGKDVSKLKVGDHITSCYPVAASSKIVIPEGVCFKSKRLPFLKSTPCVSYLALAWELYQRVLPKAKYQRKLGIFSCVPDSALLKVLTLIAGKLGWHAKVVNADWLSQGSGNVGAVILLPPYNESVITKAACLPGVRDIVLVSGNQLESSVSQSIFREKNEDICMHVLSMCTIMQKSSLKAQMPHIYRWLKSLHLDRDSLAFETVTFQKVTSTAIDFLSVEEPDSYFSCRIMPVVNLRHNQQLEFSDIPLLPKPKQLFKKNSVYVVTGGLSGLGFETVKFISQRGGGNIVILSRSGPSPQMQKEISDVTNQCGSLIISLECDVSISEQVDNAIGEIGKRFPSSPIKGVFHSAVVLHDGLVESLNKSLYAKVMRPKVNGVLNLHHATKHCQLDYFVCYSSITAFLGNASQTNYASANTFMDTFCHFRRSIGLAGQSINWGALNLGLLLNKEHFQRFLEAKGMMVIDVTEIHESLEQCLLLNKPQQAVCKFNFKNIRYNVLSQNVSLTMRLSHLVEEGLRKDKMTDSQLEQKRFESSPKEYLQSLISETVSVEQEELGDDTILSTLGIDSMLAMTLQNLIFLERGVNIPLVNLLDPNSTVSTIVEILTEHKGNSEGVFQSADQSMTVSYNTEESTRF